MQNFRHAIIKLKYKNFVHKVDSMDIKQKPADRPDFEDSEYIRDQIEWQEHQFNPYYFTGGKMFPFLKNPAKPFWVGVVLLLAGLVALIGVVITLVGLIINSGQADLDRKSVV